MKRLRQWVLWKAVWQAERDKFTKQPHQTNGRFAKSTDPATWTTFDAVVEAYGRGGFDGIGFVLSENDPFVGIDLDHCRDKETGVIEAWALDAVSSFDSYAEVSPSGTGVRIFIKGKLPPGGRKSGGVEVYESGRYLTVTGRTLEGC